MSRFLALELLDNRFSSLHGLRVLAIVSVVQFHVSWIFAGENGIAIDDDYLQTSLTIFFGMDLFFVLSGFLIGTILLRSMADGGKAKVGPPRGPQSMLLRFYVRRISRTFPSYYFVLAYLTLTTALTASQRRHVPLEFAYATNFLSLRRDDVVMFWGWSLALEEQFYLTVPLLFFGLRKLASDRAKLVVLVVLWLGALAARMVLFFGKRPWTDLALYEALYFRPLTRFDTLIAGIILAFVHFRWKAEIGRWLELPRHRAILALTSLACLWLLLRPWMFGHEHVQIVHVFAWGTVTSVMYFGWLLLLLHGDGWIHRALSIPIFRKIATLGYGVYLVHIPVIDHVLVPVAKALERRHVPMFVVWPMSLAALIVISLVLAYVLHVLIEKPALRLRERIAG